MVKVYEYVVVPNTPGADRCIICLCSLKVGSNHPYWGAVSGDGLRFTTEKEGTLYPVCKECHEKYRER